MAQREDVRNGRKARATASPSLSNEGGLWEATQRFWQKSYAGDYAGLVVLTAAYIVIKVIGEPFHQMFRLDDSRIQHPHAEVERVGVHNLFFFAGGIPLVVILAITLYRRQLDKAHVTILGLVIAILTTTFVTDVLKDAVGRPRPDLLARCSPELTAPAHELVTVDICTETSHHLLHDGWRSFPSGHSSFSFAGLGWLALFFASQTHVLRPRASLTSVLVCLAPLLGAALIAVSRLEDYRHDVFDVMTGSVLGLSIAYMHWRRYFPSLLARNCDEPYSPPGSSGATSPVGRGRFERVRDEEEGLGVDLNDDESGYGREGNR